MERAAVPDAALAAAYDAAERGCLAVGHDPPGVVVARGSTALDFLHRMSTNDLSALPPLAVRGTVLTTAIGRIVDVIDVIRRPDDTLLITGPGQAETVRAWLGRHIFFNDDVVLDSRTDIYRLWGWYGPQADESARELGDLQIPTGERVTVIDDGLVWEVVRPVRGLRCLAGPSLHRAAAVRWGDCAPGSPSAAAYEVLRIEAGLPAPGAEIDPDVIPLEIGLWDRVSFTKGCYIGQEVIARMESRSRIARRLVGLHLATAVELPQGVIVDGQAMGRMTSVATSPRLGPIGLALIRAMGDRLPEQAVLAPAGVPASIRELPFG